MISSKLAIRGFNLMLERGGKVAESFVCHVSKPIEPPSIKGLKYARTLETDTLKLKRLTFTPTEILDMKPSEFDRILSARKFDHNVKDLIANPHQLNLYDELVSLEEIKCLPLEQQEQFFTRLFIRNESQLDTGTRIGIIPRLLKKGYSPELVAELSITPHNQNVIESVLSKQDIIEKYIDRQVQDYIKRCGLIMDFQIENIRKNTYKEISKYIDNRNIKYFAECLNSNGALCDLPYWNKETTKILNDFTDTTKYAPLDIFDRLYRRDHTYESVKEIFGTEKITELSEKLLEFKNYKKFKDIGLEEFKQLSVEDKKEFINSFISSLTPKTVMKYKNGHSHPDIDNFEMLKPKLKMYQELNTNSNETFIKSYQNTVRSMLNELPESERIITKAPTRLKKTYFEEYRKANPIPPLEDDLSRVLDIKSKTIRGKNVKIAEIDSETALGISTHRFHNEGSIMNLEALEITDPDMFICIGTKGGSRGLNWNKDYAATIAVKPREFGDLHVQAWGDIDSGNNASKNLFNFENIMQRHNGNHCGSVNCVPELLKKRLNLSQREYTQRMQKLSNCTTLQEIKTVDPEIEKALRDIIKKQDLYEGIIRPTPMGILVNKEIPLEKISDDIINYCIRRDIPIIQVIPPAPKEIQSFGQIKLSI